MNKFEDKDWDNASRASFRPEFQWRRYRSGGENEGINEISMKPGRGIVSHFPSNLNTKHLHFDRAPLSSSLYSIFGIFNQRTIFEIIYNVLYIIHKTLRNVHNTHVIVQYKILRIIVAKMDYYYILRYSKIVICTQENYTYLSCKIWWISMLYT